MNPVVLLLLGLAAAASAMPRQWDSQILIVGGEIVKKNELPYQLSLQISSRHGCGASILNENYGITAAHCVNPDYTQYYRVVAGEHDLDADDGTEQIRAVSKVIVHEDYNAFQLLNDIALIKFQSPLNLNEFVKPVTLPSPNFDAAGNALVSGWGHQVSGGSNSNFLRKVGVPIISDGECEALYPREKFLPSMICAGYPEGGKDACQNDSGGPLAVQVNDGSSLLVGVVSWGYGCAEPNHPGVYTEVSKFVDWIQKNAV